MSGRALLSVFDKSGIEAFASFLSGAGWEIVSTGGTALHLQQAGIPVTDVSAVTGFPECLDGRVKTLHPSIHAGILSLRGESHAAALQELGITPIDLVCANLYPFFEKSQGGDRGSESFFEEAAEFIDIGGPAMLRAAAKNYRHVTVLTDPPDYELVTELLKAGGVPLDVKKRLAGRVFNLTAAYDAAISRFLLEEEYPKYWPLSLEKKQSLRYGENPHQSAAFYMQKDRLGALAGMEQLGGKEMGYNNIRDLDLAWKAACAFALRGENVEPFGEADVRRLAPSAAFDGKVCCVAVKHNTPCGIALGGTLYEAFEKTAACDPVSIFGGVVACNCAVDAKTAAKLSDLFLEIVAAFDFDGEALELLKAKKNLRIIKLKRAPLESHECASVDGGLLVQNADRRLFEKWEVATKTQPPADCVRDMVFGMRAVSFVKSNAIVIVKDEAASGIGGGQVNRIWPAQQALARSAEVINAPASPWKDKSPAGVLASDAFLPFDDVVHAAAAAGVRAIIQPGGSVNDNLAVEAADRHGIAMVFTGTRHFKH